MKTNPEFYFNHEVRIRIVEKTARSIHNILLWLLGTVIVGIAIPVTLHSFGLI